ncbi:MAG: guanylate kinase [Parasporobacterium sp.]|nr:guanylate kinase [Parasporobacterium sp.]
MGKIFFLMGKSASGKDTIFKKLLEDESLELIKLVGYTTRPIRSGETEGDEYYFRTVEQLNEMEAAGKVIEKRVYHTVFGDWFYFSVYLSEADLAAGDYLYIGTLESFVKMREVYGSDIVIPVYIEVEDGLRLERALARERSQEVPMYTEMCRRFVTDSEDFSEENIEEAGIEKRFQNVDMECCLNEIRAFINAVR